MEEVISIAFPVVAFSKYLGSINQLILFLACKENKE